MREVVPNANHRAHGVHPLCKRCLPPLLCSPPPPPCFNYTEEVAARLVTYCWWRGSAAGLLLHVGDREKLGMGSCCASSVEI